MDTAAFNGHEAANRFEEQRENARTLYSNAINDITDRILAEFILPGDQVAIAQDVAEMTAFLMAVKIATLDGTKPDRRTLMRAWWPIEKGIKQQVPTMLMQFMDALNEQPTGDQQ